MTADSVTNKKVLSVVLVIALVSLAGCVGPVGEFGILGEDNNSEQVDPVDAVPQESNFVMKVDPVGFAEDPTTRDIGNYVLSNFTQTNQSFESQLNSSFEDFNNQVQAGLDKEDVDVQLQIQDLGDIILFGDTEQLQPTSSGLESIQPSATTLQQQPTPPTENISNQYFGMILEVDLTESEITELFNATGNTATSSTFEQKQYKGKTIFTVESNGESASLAVLGTGVHALGPTSVVEDTIDTYVGDSESANESIIPKDGVNTYLSVGSSDISQNLTGVSEEVESIDEDPSVESVLVTYSTNGDDTANISTDLTMDSTRAAFQLQLEAQSRISEIQGGSENQTSELEFIEPVLSKDNINIGSDEATLKLDYKVTTDELKEFIDGLQDSPIGSTPTQPDETSPDSPVPNTPQISLSTQVENSTSNNATVRIDVDENENVDRLRVTEQLGNNESIYDNPRQGDTYIFETGSSSNVEIYGKVESERETLLDFVFIE